MDADIEQLLKSLNIDGISVEEPDRPPIAPPVSQPFSPRLRPHKQQKSSLFMIIGGAALCGILVGGGLFVATDWWIKPSRRVVHVYEAPSVPRMVPPFISAVQRVDPWSSNNLDTRRQPSGEGAPVSVFSGHLDILKAAAGRRQALEEVRADIDSLLTSSIHSPDLDSRRALHSALARYDLVDLHSTQSLIPLLISTRSALTTPSDLQKFQETLAYAGLGKGLEGYAKTAVQIRATEELIADFLKKIGEERDLCRLAKMLDGALQLLSGLRSDSLMVSVIDIDDRRKEVMATGRQAVETVLRALPAKSYPQWCSPEERKAVVFLQEQFPSIDTELFARVDGFLTASRQKGVVTAAAENKLGSDSFSSSAVRLLMAPEGVMAEETALLCHS